jgi:hypothetical protein
MTSHNNKTKRSAAWALSLKKTIEKHEFQCKVVGSDKYTYFTKTYYTVVYRVVFDIKTIDIHTDIQICNQICLEKEEDHSLVPSVLDWVTYVKANL